MARKEWDRRDAYAWCSSGLALRRLPHRPVAPHRRPPAIPPTPFPPRWGPAPSAALHALAGALLARESLSGEEVAALVAEAGAGAAFPAFVHPRLIELG